MQAQNDSVVTIHYTLTVDGAKVESSYDAGEPLHALLGGRQLIPALERAIEGHMSGDRFHVLLGPADAYGERRVDAMQRVPKKYFRDTTGLKPGATALLALRDGGHQMVTVRKVGMNSIDVDTNHPMAGKTLEFEVELISVREASADELAHGHVHGPGGAH